MTKTHLLIAITAIHLLPLAAGCQQQQQTYTLAGEVRVAGQRPDDGSIAFEPESGGPVRGGQLEQGKFRVEKVPAGKARVKFVVRKKTGTRKPAPDAPSFDVSVDILPVKYRDGVTVDVTGDQTNLVFNLDGNAPESK